MRLAFFFPKVPFLSIKRTQASVCEPLASLMIVGACKPRDGGDDVCKCHVPEACHTCREVAEGTSWAGRR
jgi:hypothetical protein